MGDITKNPERWVVILAWSLGLAILAIIGLVVALVVVATNSASTGQMMVYNDAQGTKNIRTQIYKAFDNENIAKRLNIISKQIHVAGTDENAQVTDYLYSTYQSFGLDVTKHSYNVFLAYPDWTKPNTLKIYQNFEWLSLSTGLGEVFGPQEAQNEMTNPKTTTWWNGYAAPGNISGNLVYVNYATVKDFNDFEAAGYSVQGKIVLCRYGELWRGAKTQEAEKRGAIGVVIFSDPNDYGPLAQDLPANFTWPDSIFLPPSGAQRGSLMNENGDPLTLFEPSKPYTFRNTDEQTLRDQLILPGIPVMPIGYRDAIKVLQSMDGSAVPESWQGGLDVIYRYSSTKTYLLTVNAQSNYNAPITDVCATLWGKDEPDRYVMMGNHYDAWDNGAFDPNSGTTVMLEMAKSLMTVVNNTGWRPRRTIRFCQWDAEEYGLIGSTEYVEEHMYDLTDRGVAYLNMDVAVKGNMSLSVAGIPPLYDALVKITKEVDNPNEDEKAAGRMTVYDSWNYYNQNYSSNDITPLMGLSGSGSDHYQFIAYIGMPILDMEYYNVPNTYSLYHSMYELPWTNTHLQDINGQAAVAMGRTVLGTAVHLADSLIIPMNVLASAQSLKLDLIGLNSTLQQDNIASQINDFDSVAGYLQSAANRLITAAQSFMNAVNQANDGRQITVRQAEMLNRRLTQYERAFINPRGLYPQRQTSRNVVYSSSLSNTYAADTFGGVIDCIGFYQDATAANNATGQQEWLKQIRQSLSDINYSFESAILTLDLTTYYDNFDSDY